MPAQFQFLLIEKMKSIHDFIVHICHNKSVESESVIFTACLIIVSHEISHLNVYKLAVLLA